MQHSNSLLLTTLVGKHLKQGSNHFLNNEHIYYKILVPDNKNLQCETDYVMVSFRQQDKAASSSNKRIKVTELNLLTWNQHFFYRSTAMWGKKQVRRREHVKVISPPINGAKKGQKRSGTGQSIRGLNLNKTAAISCLRNASLFLSHMFIQTTFCLMTKLSEQNTVAE